MRYFCISSGLRGCYMPDSVYHVACDTRRDLKSALQSAADVCTSDDTVGLTKRNVAWLAARAWREAGKKGKREYLPFVAPYKYKGQSDYHYGLFCSVASRSEYLEAQESEQ